MAEEHFFDELKRYVGFSVDDEALLRAVGPRVTPHAQAIADDFFAHLLRHPGARRAITGGEAQVASLRRAIIAWIGALFEGPWDLAYYERRARIGRRHVQISLPQHYMFTAMSVIRGHLTRVALDTAVEPARGRDEAAAIDRLLDLELAVMLHTYSEDTLARLQRSERLATFGQFAASIAHELRNPLGVIESSTFLVRKRLGDAPEAVARHLEKIDAQVQLSNRIITNVLDLVRDRAATPSAARPAALLAAARASFAHPFARHHERIEEPLPDVWVDPDHARQILVNLLSNAYDAAAPDGEVLVRVRADGPSVLFVVSDSGAGIDPAVRARLFEPLVTTKVRGIGLGLALCRRLAERNGGTVSVVRGELSGAGFELRLPAATREEGRSQ